MTLSPRLIGLVAGIALPALMILLGPPAGLSWPAWLTGCLLVLMAAWWATEAIPIPATSLLPLVVLPIIGGGNPVQAAAGYSHPVVMLLMGGFILALGIERWNLHRRIAIHVVAAVGTGQYALIFGFMAATALLSMWISNTATTLMMVPIVMSAAAAIGDKTGKFTVAVLLGVCYSASIGGIATPIGTPTNLIAIDWLQTHSGATIGFPQWMMFGVPAMCLLVPAAWWIVTRNLPRLEGEDAAVASVRKQRSELGPISAPEARAAMVFGAVALLWISRVFIQEIGKANDFTPVLLMGISDMGIAMFGAVAMFLIPAGGGENRSLLNWEEAARLPWGVVILFGGGISLGQAITRTGLSVWIGDHLGVLSALPSIFFVAAVVAMVIFLTELTSNVATMTTLAPILGSLAMGIGIPPETLLGPTALAASCAFMLPVATAPNAIIYASGAVTVPDMMRAGVRLNLMGIVIITLIGYWIAPIVL